MRPSRLAPLLLVLAATACTEGAYIERAGGPELRKSPEVEDGLVKVCHAGDDLTEGQALADQACRELGYHAALIARYKWRCSVSAPHQAVFMCTNPAMRFRDGKYVNPADPSAVQRWQREQQAAASGGAAVPFTPSRPGSEPRLKDERFFLPKGEWENGR